MEQLTLNDGTAVNGHIIDNGDNQIIFVRLDNMSIDAGFILMRDTNKTSCIKALSHGNERIYVGYTIIKSINSEFGNCNLVMAKS